MRSGGSWLPAVRIVSFHTFVVTILPVALGSLRSIWNGLTWMWNGCRPTALIVHSAAVGAPPVRNLRDRRNAGEKWRPSTVKAVLRQFGEPGVHGPVHLPS